MGRSEQKEHMRRHVYYISGFDPRGPGFLHGTCKRECRRWSDAADIPITVGARAAVGENLQQWTLAARHGAESVETRFVFLGWDDIIRAHWPRAEPTTAFRALLWFFGLVFSGIYARALRQSWPFAVTLTAAAGKGLTALAITLLVLAAIALALLVPTPLGYGLAAIPLLAALALGGWARADLDRFRPGWTSRIGIFSTRFAAGHVPELGARIDSFAQTIIAGIETDHPREALIVGHSFGTALATLVMARVLECRPHWAGPGSPLALVTLGQIQSFVADHPKAVWFRDKLAAYQSYPEATWFDFSSPPDGACYALVNILGHLDPPPPRVPVHLNAQFHKTFSPERMAQARSDRLEMHFLYLKAPDHPQPRSDLYDFIALVAGPLTIGERFGARQPGRPFYARGAS